MPAHFGPGRCSEVIDLLQPASVLLQVKMQSVGGSYDARLGRVMSARGLLEGQIQQQLVLLEGYSRIASMIEIEVEMNTSVRRTQITAFPDGSSRAELQWCC